MSIEKYDFISEIDTVKSSWKLKVKVLSLWKTAYELQMIVMDEKCDKIGVVVRQFLWPDFEKDLEEGGFFILSRFGVGENKGKYPILKHKFKLNFYKHTSLRRVYSFDGPNHHFQFLPFCQVFDKKGDPNLPVDIIGKIVDCGNLDDYLKPDEQVGKRINLELEDIDYLKLKCTLWDEFAQQVHDYVVQNNSQDDVVMIIQFGRIKEWDVSGLLTIQNAYYSTKLFIDADLPEVTDFRQRLRSRIGAASSSQGVTQLSSQRVHSVLEDFSTKKKRTIGEIFDATEPIVCVVLATITGVEEGHGWFYIACRKCNKKVIKMSDVVDLENTDVSVEKNEKEDGKLYCPKCKGVTSSVFPSYKVQVRVQDGSGTTSFVMFDREVTKLVHKSAVDIREQQIHEGDSDTFPNEFQSLLGKRILFKVSVTAYNIDNGYQVYTVTKLCNDPTLMAKFDDNQPGDDDRDDDHGGHFEKAVNSKKECFPIKDVVSCTGDSSNALEGDSSFTGGSRYMMQNYLDAMAIVRRFGYPDLFVTFTCNPKWPEIVRFNHNKNPRPEDIPDILCRLFKMKLDSMIKDFKENHVFGEFEAGLYTIEFQKRGLPHAHICIFLKSAYKFTGYGGM